MNSSKCAAKAAATLETANSAKALAMKETAFPAAAAETANAAKAVTTKKTVHPEAAPGKIHSAKMLAEAMMEAADGVACKRCGKVFFHSSLWVRLCPECRETCVTGKNHYSPSRRVCHDCGKATTNYRCAACWTRFRAKHDVPQDVLDW